MIVFVNRFTVSGSTEEFEELFGRTSEYMRSQPGFIHHRLVRAQRDQRVYLNIAEWESEEFLLSAIGGGEFQVHAKELRRLADSDPNVCELVLDRDPVTG